MNLSENNMILKSSSDNSNKNLIESSTDLPDSESLYGTPDYNDFWSQYVPNPNFAKKLNKKGEIMINDTIYKITPNGTYFYYKTLKSDFKKLYEADSTAKGTLISKNLYLMGKNIYRYDTFAKQAGDEIVEINANSNSNNNGAPSLRNVGAEPDYNTFSYFNSDRTTVIGKIIENLIGAKKDFTVYYNCTDNRRVKGSFYSYNYAFYAECGAEGWTDKKNWIGWSKTPADELRIGWHNVVLVTKLPDYQKQMMKQMTISENFISYNQYIDIPGSMYKVNVMTMIIPNFNATAFDKAVALGAPAVFIFLKGQLSGSPNLNQKSAFLILTNTHLITYIPNQDIALLGCEHYAFVFASQIKFLISFSTSAIPSDKFQWAAYIANVIMQSSAQAYPTLAAGEVHVAARFGSPYEWEGMKIKKQTSSVLSALQ